eukprot:scaffold1048_cov115-Phaeocystis_antarctica.AAC.1
MAYWRLSPEVSESAKRFEDVQQCVPGQPLPPPSLPSSVPLHMTSEVGHAVRAMKVAWLLESNKQGERNRRRNLGRATEARGTLETQRGRRTPPLTRPRSEASTCSVLRVSSDQVAHPTRSASPGPSDTTACKTAGIQQPDVQGIMPQAVRFKIANDKKKDAPRHQPALPAAIEDDSIDELPPLRSATINAPRRASKHH